MSAKKRERQGVGRPPKDPSERQRNRVLVTFTDDEYEQLVDAAGTKPLGTFLREVVSRWLKGRRQR